jgi:rubrerythrin
MRKTKEVIDALNKALNLEAAGKKFYLECAAKTKDANGKKMFQYLAGEEETHYEKVEKIYREEFNKEFMANKDNPKRPLGIFELKVPGGSLDEKAGALDALNIALRAEENSIMLYTKLTNAAHSDRMKKIFNKLLGEEDKHYTLIKQEIETMTKTGGYYDFKVVTS